LGVLTFFKHALEFNLWAAFPAGLAVGGAVGFTWTENLIKPLDLEPAPYTILKNRENRSDQNIKKEIQ
jgi:hypothetical protein